jgi:hypothetical protein
MAELGFQALARKLLLGRGLETIPPRARRLAVRPHVEELEDRTVSSTPSIQLPEMPAAASVAAVSSGRVETISGDPVPALHDSVNTSALDGSALERLLEDVQKIEAKSAHVFSDHATIHLRLTRPWRPMATRGSRLGPGNARRL